MYSSANHHQHRHHPHLLQQQQQQLQQQQEQLRQGFTSPESAAAVEIFEQLCAASTFKSVLHLYRQLCDVLKLKPTNIRNFYPKLKSRLRSWKAQALWNKFDKRAAHKCYNHGKACQDCKVLIIGAGPCGLRSAIEAQLLGAKVVVIEKRDRFSRNNVLHLWPFVITDLKQLGAKKFYGKFCAGAIDHISIRQLQCILLKVALLLGVEVFESVSFEELVEPPANQEEKIGWRARLSPPDHPANQYEFDCLFGADGKRNTLPGFRRKEFRGKLAIAITANFINKRSEAEARVQEISGVAFIFNQKFFKELYAATGIDLENIVYYKDETHYFVMTAKKHSLIDKGVILNDVPDTQELLHSSNVDRNALLEYAREAADFSTNYQLPHLDFAVNHYGKPDVAMFDFTSMFAAENACRMWERNGHKLLTGLVGDTLLEPFWPTGSGCARGFLGCFDGAWMLRSWATGKMSPLEVLAERESVYRLLAQTTPENLSKDHVSYMLDPSSRYPTINLRAVLPFQVRNLFDTDDPSHQEDGVNPQPPSTDDLPKKRKRRDSFIHPDTLLVWCKKQVALYDSVKVDDMAGSFKDGRVLCAIIHRYRPDLIDFDALTPEDIADNNQLAFDILERDFGIPPVMTGAEMAEIEVPDKLTMISYLSQIYDVFRGEIPHFKYPKMDVGEMEVEDGAGQRSTTRHVNILKNLTNKTASVAQAALSARKRLSQDRAANKSDGRVMCRVVEDGSSVAAGDRKSDSLKKTKKRRSDRVTSPLDKEDEEDDDDDEEEEEGRQRRQEIQLNRAEYLRKQRERRELEKVRFIRSMQMLQFGGHSLNPIVQPSYQSDKDEGISEYRKQNNKTMREKAEELERKLNHRPERSVEEEVARKAQQEQSGDFNEKVKDLEAKFTSRGNANAAERKPKDLLRAIGKIERSDWNVAAIEKKMHENKFGLEVSAGKEKVPMWSRDNYDDKFNNIERRLRENGEDEETIAKYRDIDSSLKRLEMKLREGSTLETGLRGKNKVSNLASQLSSKLEKKEPEKVLVTKQQPSRPLVPLPSSGSDLCHFCGNRVYLVERLSAEGKFFHRQCFKCDYCAANLRLGNYIYDREGRYGGKFFCIPHFGLAPRAKGLRYRGEDTDSAKENIVPTATTATTTTATATPIQLQVPAHVGGDAGGKAGTGTGPGTPTIAGLTPEDRGTTPERVEFENSVVEQSDEDEYLSEDEWTDRNFGASANELDESDGEDSDYSDLSDEEAEDEEMEFLEGGGKLTAAETRRLAESWQRRYSTDNLDDRDSPHSGKESESDLDSDNFSEECGAEGDESHTATEGEGGEEDDEEEEEGEAVKRARELRRLEVNIDVTAPPRKAETSDSGSDTEVASDEESEESDTQIDTDSEFADDHVPPGPPKSIPTIVINETHDPRQESPAPEDKAGEEARGEPRASLVSQRIDLGQKQDEESWAKENGEKSASLTNLNETGQANPRAEQLKRLLQRTDSTEAIAAQRALQLKRQYLLGENSNLPRKSVSTADLGNRFKSFMDKISETQKMLNPAPQPSAAMQAFMSTSVSTRRSPSSSPSSPQLTARSISLPQGDEAAHTNNATTTSSSTTTTDETRGPADVITTRVESSVYPVEGREGQEGREVELKGFPSPPKQPQGGEEATQVAEECLAKIPLSHSSSESSESSSSSSSSSSSGDGSDYDNVPTGSKWSPPKKSPTAIELQQQQQPSTGVTDSAFSDGNARTSDTATDLPANTQPPPPTQPTQGDPKGSSQEPWVIDRPEGRSRESEEDNVFGLSLPSDTDAGVETVNRALVLVNAPRSLEGPYTGEAVPLQEEQRELEELGGTKRPVVFLVDDLERDNEEENVDELFNKLASDAVEDIDKFSELVESSTPNHNNYNGFPFCDEPDPRLAQPLTLTPCHTEGKEDTGSSVATVCVAAVVEAVTGGQGVVEAVTGGQGVVEAVTSGQGVASVVEGVTDGQGVASVRDSASVPSESKLSVIRDSSRESREGKEAEGGREAGLSPKSEQPSPLTASPSEELLPPPTKESLSSPEEGREYTETELSDWAGDNGGVSAGEDLEVEVNQRDRPSHRASPRVIARIASEESLGDTDSAISSGHNVTTSAPAKPPPPPATLADLDGIEFMDTSESASSPEELSHHKQGYRKLEEETPTTPLAPQISLIGQPDPSHQDPHSSSSSSSQSDSTSTELDTSQSSVQEAPSAAQQAEGSPAPPPKSMSEPPSLSEPRARLNGERRHDSLEECTTTTATAASASSSPRRYEGYIPRFKERMSPFGYVRDSIDVHKTSSRTSLASPRSLDGQTEDQQEEEGEEEEQQQQQQQEQQHGLGVEGSPARSTSKVSPTTAKRQIERSLKRTDKDKEKDLIKEMVMSRLSRRSTEKTPRRSSRTSPSPLSSTSSRTSLFSPQSSQENLLERHTSTSTTPSTTPSTATEVPPEECSKRHIHVDGPALLRLDTVQQELPDGGQTFGAEENRAKIRVGNFFRDDSVLGGPMLGSGGSGGSLHDVNVPFVDESQDEDVSERHEASCRSTPSTATTTKHRSPATKRPAMPDATPRPKLPATPLTHPEQFSSPPVKFPGPPSSPPPSLNSLTSLSAPNTPRSSATAPASASHTPRSTPAPRGSPATPRGTTTPVPTSVTPVPIRPHRASTHAKGPSSPSERPLSTPNLGTVERERAREEARGRAKLLTDHALGLSPPNLADNLREKLKKAGPGQAEAEVPTATPRPGKTVEGVAATTTRDKEERVRELLAEQRQQRRQREAPPDAGEEPASKEDRLRERLEEYRQRQRGGSTRNGTTAAAASGGGGGSSDGGGGDGRPKSQLVRRHTHHRPSLLELESLQVFTAGLGPSKSASCSSVPLAGAASLTTHIPAPSHPTPPPTQQPYSIPPSPAPSSTTTASSTTSTPASQPSQDSPSDRKPSGKKSKDRERRRSLIQVFTGMFTSKSDDKKKGDHSEASDAHSTTTTTATTIAAAPPNPAGPPAAAPPTETPKAAPPKSPLTVRDKLSKLRLPRSKEKKKQSDKGRSTSVDEASPRDGQDPRAALSLPTSPSRRPLTLFPSSFTKSSSPPQASEESLSEEDAGTPSGTLERGQQAPWSGSSGRKQRSAAFKAARQAELKRLRMAQEIQRQLEECEVKTRELEERGVATEKALRGEAGGVERDEAELMSDWFAMVHEKNALVRWEQELMVRAKELELEDRHVRLEHELRHRMALSEHEKSREDIDREGTILAEMLSILEQKDALVTMLEEDRQRCGHYHTPSTPSTSTTITTASCFHFPHITPSPPTTPLTSDLALTLKCMSLFTNPPSRRPSIFDLDPCSRAGTHSQHALGQAGLYSQLGRVRRCTVPDLTSWMSLPPDLLHSSRRRFSLASPSPYSSLSAPAPSVKQCGDGGGEGGSEGVSSTLSTICGYVVVVVVAVWFLPYIQALLSLLGDDAPPPSPF